MEQIIRGLSEAWERYAKAAPSMTEDEEERQYLALAERIREAGRETPDVLSALRDVALMEDGSSGTPPRGFREFVRGVLIPDAMLALEDADAFAKELEVGFSSEVMPVRAALALPVASQLLGAGYSRDQLEFQRSWFAGTPVTVTGDDWPRRTDGTALRPVLQVALNEEAHNVVDFASTGLPGTGILQVFHDLTTCGELGDAALNSWSVRWLEDPDGDLRESAALMNWPTDLPEDSRIAAVPINADVAPTIPSPLDVESLSDEEFERYERVRAYLDWWPLTRNLAGPMPGGAAPSAEPIGNPWEPGYVPTDPVSRLGGFSHFESNPDHTKILQAALPVVNGDQHVLLADINPRQFTDADWFHGGRHLEIWIRHSDLDSKRFDNVWCFIRTDG